MRSDCYGGLLHGALCARRRRIPAVDTRLLFEVRVLRRAYVYMSGRGAGRGLRRSGIGVRQMDVSFRPLPLSSGCLGRENVIRKPGQRTKARGRGTHRCGVVSGDEEQRIPQAVGGRRTTPPRTKRLFMARLHRVESGADVRTRSHARAYWKRLPCSTLRTRRP